MVVRVEEHVATIASPQLAADGSDHQRLCTSTYEGNRYIFYGVDSLLVVLHENHTGAIPNNPRSEAKRLSQFDLWQVWDVHDTVRCVRFNTTTKRVARGALAVCMDEGRVVLMTPTSAASNLPTAAPPPTALVRTASRLTIKTSEADLKPVSSSSSGAMRRASLFGGGLRPGSTTGNDITSEYVKLHLHLQLPTWQESIRWKADDDRSMDRVEWVESGEDVWLVGAGEKITTWKLVEESGVVAYQQFSFAIGEPEQRVWHMDITLNGRFVATAGRHDRIVKLWSLGELSHDGTPVCSFLSHRRALVSLAWTRYWHAFKIQNNQAPQSNHCEMLFALDRSGAVTIWRENVASPSRSFTRWKVFSIDSFLYQSGISAVEQGDNTGVVSPLRSLTLVSNTWTRSVPKTATAFTDALLEESNVMSALSQFHYGYTSLDEVRRNELLNQRMDGIAKVNAKLLGARSGMVADSHSGEAFIAGNAGLAKTFLVNLVCGIHEAGELSFFRVESVPFTVSAPRVALICMFSGLSSQLAGATVHRVCSADYKDRESGFSSFLIEVLYQPTGNETQLKVARLKLQVESGGMKGPRSAATYSVQMCEFGDASASVMASFASPKPSDTTTDSLILAKFSSSNTNTVPDTVTRQLAVALNRGELEVMREGSRHGSLQIVSRKRDLLPSTSSTVSHTVVWPSQRIVFTLVDGCISATNILDEVAGTPGPSPQTAHPALNSKLLFLDDEKVDDADPICQLIICGVSASQKKSWSSAPTSFFFNAQPTDESAVAKDFCVVLGLKSSNASLQVWVFSLELPAAIKSDNADGAVLQLSVSPLKLFRRTVVDIPSPHKLNQIATTPSLDFVGTTFAGVDAQNHSFSLWTFTDMDDLTSIECTHSSDIGAILKAATKPNEAGQDALNFFSSRIEYKFCDFAVSHCGRAALLYQEQGSTSTSGNAVLCVVSIFDTWHESLIPLPVKNYGQIISVKWTPPISPAFDSQIVFLSSSMIGVVSINAAPDVNDWAVTWTSTRLTAKPKVLSDMAQFPRLYMSLGTGIADLNLDDLMSSPRAWTSTNVIADSATTTSHPLSLLFLLMRGNFASLDRALNHIKQSIVDHEKTCYLKMQEDQELRKLPFMSLETLLGKSDGDSNVEERSTTFTKGKSGSYGASSNVSSRGSLARASDLFATDFGSVRRTSLAIGIDLNGNLDSLFSTPSSLDSADDRLGVEMPEMPAFFSEHQSFLTFLSEEMRQPFLDIVNGCKKVVAWDKDSSRSKDEPTLRFMASMLWPYKRLVDVVKSPVDTTSTSNEDALTNEDDESSDSAIAAAAGICSEQVAWAALSEYQNELLQECFPVSTFTLQELTQLRLPFWVKSHAKLLQFTEKAAQAEYASTRDPFRVALLYILLGKTKLLVSLFKMGNESKIADLLSNDFSDARWKNAAVKNAYVLKAKRRHELSAAFFLLGGKVQEAMSVAEHADRTLTLSFLIARLSERWDLGGASGDGPSSDSYGGGYAGASFTGLSSSLRTFSAVHLSGSDANSEAYKDVCKEYLKSTVWTKAQACGDVFMCFLVKYLIGETTAAVQALLTIPRGDVCSMFEPTPSSCDRSPRLLYWRVFGQSLLGAAELVRYLKSTIPRMTSAMKTQIMHLQTITLNRLFAMGFNTIALYHQRDFAMQFKKFCQENVPHSSAVRGEIVAARHRILSSIVSGQSLKLANTTMKSISSTLNSSATPSRNMNDGGRSFEEDVDAELECVVSRGGDYNFSDLPETGSETLQKALKVTIADSLHQHGRTAVEDFLITHWSNATHTHARDVPVQELLDSVVDGIATVACGDLNTSATTQFHSKRIDQVCSELLDLADNLLMWLAYFFNGRRPASKTGSSSAPPSSSPEYIRVVTAAVYSVIAVCSRYIKAPCCVYRSLASIFPHMEPLTKKTVDEIKDIALADVCEYCSTIKPKSSSPTATSQSSLQRDIPMLYQILRMLRHNLHIVIEEVRTNRLELVPPTLFFSYCQYWTLVIALSANRMPAHVSKVAVEGANPHSAGTTIARRLVMAWTTYSTNLAKYSARVMLSELTESFFRPYNNVRAPATPTGSAPVTPRGDGSSSTSSASVGASAPGPSTPTTASPGVLSPHVRDRRESRQLLRCSCDRCPWLLVLKMFADKDELLLRINSQLECCSEKIKDEISWGHLPDFPSRKAALTRSQKILLSAAAAGKSAEVSDMLEKRMLQSSSTIQLDAHCIYRSEVSIKSLCFNRATETSEMVLCSSRGISRTASVEYSDGTKYQFKGMFTFPQASVAHEGSSLPARRKTSDMTAMGRSSTDSPQRDAVSSSSELKTPSFKPTAVESHPFLPLFVSGNQKGKVHLWSYESLNSVCEFQTREVVPTYPLTPVLSGRRDIKKIHFDNLGQQMGTVDSLGRLFMWKFANLDRAECYRDIDCHDKGAKALQFINSSSIVATAGSSSDKRSVCMWDLLLPNSKALIAAPTCHPAGAASLTFSPTHQLLISGGEGGSISVFDVRQRRVLHTVTNAHETAITTLELHPSGRCVLSGSASGDVKIWSLPIFRELVAVSKVHAKPSFLGDAASNLLGDAASNMAINVTSSSWGVTDAFATDDYFFTSGTDGSVQRFRVPSLGTVM